MDRSRGGRGGLIVFGLGIVATTLAAPLKAQELCGGVDYPFPYTDVSAVGAAFCPGIMEAYVTGVSKGTTPTTFSPSETVTRVQMTTFLQRALDQGLARSSRRGALGQWWTASEGTLQSVSVGALPVSCAGDGADIWVTSFGTGHVTRVEANTGKVLDAWTGATYALGLTVGAGKVFVAGQTSPGAIYAIDPTQAPGALVAMTTLDSDQPSGIAFDGTNLWTANFDGTLSVVNAQTSAIVYTLTAPTLFVHPTGIVYDGTNFWVTDFGAANLYKIQPNPPTLLAIVAVGADPQYPVFDGTNVWVPNTADSSITVVNAASAAVVGTITSDESNGLASPTAASFDGERILVTNAGGSVTLFKAADLSLLGNVATGAATQPVGACADGVNFWVADQNNAVLLRF